MICSALYAFIVLFGNIALAPLMDGISKTEEFGCGVMDEHPRAILSEAASEGKGLYQSQCMACHSIFKDLTGPALGAALENPFWSDSLKIIRYIQDPKAFNNEKYIIILRSRFGSKQQPFPGMSDEQLINIVKYIMEEKKARDAFQVNDIPY